jgi:uncharacterized protein YdeI (BOF family)
MNSNEEIDMRKRNTLHFWKASFWSLAALALFTMMPAMAGDKGKHMKADKSMAAEKNPHMQADDTWINLSGTVDSVTKDSFMLDYGKGLIKVEMDDGDRDADGYKLVQGDKVTVSGMVDDDFYETTTIEASSVYVENLGTYFYASAIDEEDTFVTLTTPITLSQTTVQGTITSVAGEEFTVDTGMRQLTVEIDEMLYNPLDDEGYQKLEVGDRVSVTGEMDNDFFEGRELVADAVVTLEKAS